MEQPSDCVPIVMREFATLRLRVSNSSQIDNPIRLKIAFDGMEFMTRPFGYVHHHFGEEFPLLLSPGEHTIRVESETGVEVEHVFTVPAQGQSHAALDYYNYADEDGMLLDWHIQNKPIGIM